MKPKHLRIVAGIESVTTDTLKDCGSVRHPRAPVYSILLALETRRAAHAYSMLGTGLPPKEGVPHRVLLQAPTVGLTMSVLSWISPN